MKPQKWANRCERCKRATKTNRYSPYCSYHCQEWARLEDAAKYLSEKQWMKDVAKRISEKNKRQK